MFTVSLQLTGVTGGEGSGASSHLGFRTCIRKPRKGEECSETRGDARPTGRRCLASTEIKNIDSHSHAGLHRGSIRFSPARQYPFFPRTVRGTNCSCIPPATLTPPPPIPRRNPKHKGSLFHLAAPSLPPPSPLPVSVYLSTRASFRILLVFALARPTYATCPNVWRRNAIHN